MAKSIWLVTKSALGGAESFVNGVNAVIINKDSAQTAAQVKAAASAKVAAAVGGRFPATYFDSAVDITDLTAGPIKDDADGYVFVDGGVVPTKFEGP